MAQLKIHQQKNISEYSVDKGSTLLLTLRSLGYNIYSPCGGNGKCGKCKVWLKGEGSVTSCLFMVDRDLEVVLPDPVEARVLTSQYEHSLSLTTDPGEAASLSTYPLGVAVDIGTTTVVLYLINLSSGSLIETKTILNPQSTYGADVISRINYCIQHEDGLQRMQTELINQINPELDNFTKALGLASDDIVKISVTGNTTMLHLFLGEDPQSLAFVPFMPVFLDMQKMNGKKLNLSCHREAEIRILPSVSAYVGADLLAGIASIAPGREIQNFLFVDVGTNGEMAILTKNQFYCCATAAGPAFEGANISCGMAAVEGAISSYDTSGYLTIGDAQPLGICGSALIDIAAFLYKEQLIDESGILTKDFTVATEKEAANNQAIKLTQQDIRELQLAKSAIASGINILMKHANVSADMIDALYLAGGFGNFINTDSAITIGLLPGELKDKVIPVGNASGTGAMLDLRSRKFINMMERLREKANYIDLSEDEDFVTEFALNMSFPARLQQ